MPSFIMSCHCQILPLSVVIRHHLSSHTEVFVALLTLTVELQSEEAYRMLDVLGGGQRFRLYDWRDGVSSQDFARSYKSVV